MAKHTPGPWRVIDHGEASVSVTDQWQDLGICRLVLESLGSEKLNELRANAQLIAAAPDLLILTKMMFERLEALGHHWESPEEHEIEMEIYREIIAKAERRD